MVWYSAEEPSGLLLAYTIVAAGCVLSYLWSIAHILLLSMMTLGIIIQCSLAVKYPDEYPLTAFYVTKCISVLGSSVLLLLVRWRVGVFGTTEMFDYNSKHIDPPPTEFGQHAFTAIAALMGVNIAEAVLADMHAQRGWYNSLLAVALIVTLPLQQQGSNTFTMAWIMAYSLWNIVFVLCRFGRKAGLVHLTHIMLPLVIAVLFHSPNAWVYLRCHALGICLVCVDHPLTAWVQGQSESKRQRWLGPCRANARQVLDQACSVALSTLGLICLFGCWIPNDYVV